MVGFTELEFNLEEENLDDNAIISGKQHKILNSKLNSILQFLNESVGKSNFGGEEVEFLLKSHESQFRSLLDSVVEGVYECLATQSRTFKHENKKLHDVAHE